MVSAHWSLRVSLLAALAVALTACAVIAQQGQGTATVILRPDQIVTPSVVVSQTKTQVVGLMTGAFTATPTVALQPQVNLLWTATGAGAPSAGFRWFGGATGQESAFAPDRTYNTHGSTLGTRLSSTRYTWDGLFFSGTMPASSTTRALYALNDELTWPGSGRVGSNLTVGLLAHGSPEGTETWVPVCVNKDGKLGLTCSTPPDVVALQARVQALESLVASLLAERGRQ